MSVNKIAYGWLAKTGKMAFHAMEDKIIGSNSVKVIFNKNYSTLPKVPLKVLKNKYQNVWKDKNIPKIQAQQISANSSDLKSINHIIDTTKLIETTKLAAPSILEIGCASAYHYGAFKKTLPKFSYTGCDYSEAFIKVAKDKYPEVSFKVCDAVGLDYESGKFDIALSGSCIQHIVGYEKAIKEAARVARKFVIFSRTPTITIAETTFVTKHAYGQEMLEVIFNETELINLFFENRLAVVSTKVLSSFWVHGIKEPVFVKSYLCQKL